MSLAPSPSAGRGGIIIQPSYFTSSLYIHPLRDDILNLIHVYTEHYTQTPASQPFVLFKTLWHSLGWTWMHFKVFDSRSRDTFLKVTMRLFLEHMVETEAALTRVVALFGLYTFFMTQPSTKAPLLHSVAYIDIPIDLYPSLLSLPQTLTGQLTPLQPYAIYTMSALVTSQAFHILPASMCHPLNPRELPREIFIQEGHELSSTHEQRATGTEGSATVSEVPPKRKGRPTKRNKKRKALQALNQVDKWLEKNTLTIQPPSNTVVDGTATAAPPGPITTHVLMSHPPTATLNNYRTQKMKLLDIIKSDSTSSAPEEYTPAQKALGRANKYVLARLKRLDQMAAEKGLEVGGEGGERTGLERVEKAVAELDVTSATSGPQSGILGLLEGAGIGNPETADQLQPEL